MSVDDPSGYLPPHELRAIAGNLVDRDDARLPGPSLATTSSPGLAPAAAAPTGFAPTLPPDDPGSIAIAIARIVGEPFPTSLVPMPTPEQLASGAGMSAPASPGISPQLVPSGPDARVPTDPIAPQLEAAPPPDAAAAPTVPTTATAPPASSSPVDSLRGLGGEVRVPFGLGDPSSVPTMDIASMFVPPIGGPSAATSPPSMPGSPTMPGTPSIPGNPSMPSMPGNPSMPITGNPSMFAMPDLGAIEHMPLVEAVEPPRDLGVPFGLGDPSSAPTMDIASMFVPPMSGPSAAASPPNVPGNPTMPGTPSMPAMPGSPSIPAMPGTPSTPTIPGSPSMFAMPGLGAIERMPLVEAVEPTRGLGSNATHDLGSNATRDLVGNAARDTRSDAPRDLGGNAFDPYLVRRDFPILEERVHGKRLVWLDNAATTQKPRAVIDRLTYYYEHENSNVHRAAHALAARATDAYESARETTRKFLSAPSASEIVFVRGATEGINLIAKSFGKRHVERGDEIVLTHLEHHANIVPWQQLCAEVGARLRVAPVDDRGDVIVEEYERLMCSRTKIVAFTQVSNALGTVTPAREMIEIAHRWGATVLLDGAQAVSHMPVDVQALDCDFYVFSGHKVFAPTGIGVVWGKRELLEEMPPWQSGGNMISDVTFERTRYQQPPWRFEAGTGNIADAAGLATALDYVLRIGMVNIDRYEHELLVYATEQLNTVPGLHMIGTAPNKAGVLSFILDGQRTEDVGSALDKDGIAVRSGHHCAQPILRRYGLESTVRASLAFYNVREDIDDLVSALKRLQAASV